MEAAITKPLNKTTQPRSAMHLLQERLEEADKVEPHADDTCTAHDPNTECVSDRTHLKPD